MVLTEPDYTMTMGKSLMYQLTRASTVVTGTNARLKPPPDKLVWSGNCRPRERRAAPWERLEESPMPLNTKNNGNLLCVATGKSQQELDVVWLEVIVGGLVTTPMTIDGPPGTMVHRHGGRWIKVTSSDAVTTAMLKAV